MFTPEPAQSVSLTHSHTHYSVTILKANNPRAASTLSLVGHQLYTVLNTTNVFERKAALSQTLQQQRLHFQHTHTPYDVAVFEVEEGTGLLRRKSRFGFSSSFLPLCWHCGRQTSMTCDNSLHLSEKKNFHHRQRQTPL